MIKNPEAEHDVYELRIQPKADVSANQLIAVLQAFQDAANEAGHTVRLGVLYE